MSPTGRPVRLRVDGPKIRAEGGTWPHREALKAVPGARWDARGKAWTYPATPAIAIRLRDALPGHVTPQFDAAFVDLLHRGEAPDRAAYARTAEDLPPIPATATEPWDHQLRGYWFAEPLDAAGLFMDMGTGKSKIVVDLVVNRGDRRVLILCPRKVVGVWPREFRLHAGAAAYVVALRQEPGRKTPLSVERKAMIAREALEEQDLLDDDRPLVIVVNYDSAWRPPLSDLILATDWDLVVLDESHRVKAPGGKASMFCGRLRDHAARRLCLTGTPMPHSPLDLYAQYRFLDPGIYGTSFVRYRNRYALMGGYSNHEVIGYQNQDELSERMYRIAFRVMADDVLDLPEYHHVVRPVTLAESAEVYGDLETDMYARVETGEITPANALVRLLRLQQVTSGHVADDDGNTVDVGHEKSDVFAEVLAELAAREPLVVFCRFLRDLDRVRAACEKPSNDGEPRRYGELSGRRGDGLTEDGTMSPDVDVVGVQVQAGGVGIDLSRARYGVFYSVGFSLGDYEQALARIHRPGQERTTTFVHLIAEGTVDVQVYEALRDKKDVIEHVLSFACSTNEEKK